MCGIVGYFSTTDKRTNIQQKKAVLSELVMTNTLRGFDSTGVFAVDENSEASFYKNIVAGWDFLDMKRTRNILMKMEDYKAVVFHNRWATVGGISVKTAHPFDFEKVIGVHNGTLMGYSSLAKDHYPVDSQYLFAGINEKGAIETIKKAEGPIAMMYYDKVQKKLCVYRNKDRPLAYAMLKDEGTFFYASERDMLEWILKRNKLETSLIADVPENVLFEINIDDHKEITQTKVSYVAPPPAPLYRGPASQWNGYRGHQNHEHEDHVWDMHQAGFTPKTTPAIKVKPDPAGYKVGDKIIAEISKAYSGTGGRYIAEGTLMGGDFVRMIMQSVSEADYKLMLPWLKKESFLLYVTIMSINSVAEHKNKWVLVSPYKPIGNYAKSKAQKRMMDSFCNDWADSTESAVLQSPTPEEVLGVDDILPVTEYVKGPGGNMITKKEFEDATRYGCCICGNIMEPKEDLDWVSFKEPAHTECVKSWDADQALKNKSSKKKETLRLPKTSDMSQLVEDTKPNVVH